MPEFDYDATKCHYRRSTSLRRPVTHDGARYRPERLLLRRRISLMDIALIAADCSARHFPLGAAPNLPARSAAAPD